MPSMRAMMTAGPALKKCHIAGYNCSYLPIDHPHAFDEVLFVLMNGTGVGFSVEPRYTEQLPPVAERFVQVGGSGLGGRGVVEGVRVCRWAGRGWWWLCVGGSTREGGWLCWSGASDPDGCRCGGCR
jgi:hypothetical protein